MPDLKNITVVGGGLAGLALGIGLRQHAVPVVIWEAGHYPRHRVCGEFISGRGQETLRRLGLLELFREAGARPAATAAFFLPHRQFPARRLPQPAWCLSRFTLDAMLAERFRDAGGELRCGSRWRDAEAGEGVVRASGRRPQATERGWRWFGLKAHARKVMLTADLELHVSRNSYVGLCRLGDGRINVCGLFRRRTQERETAPKWWECLQGEAGTELHRRLAGAEWEAESFCAVAGLALNPRRAATLNECCVGDALTMIAPVTGNGMSMAFEGAELAVDPLVRYAQGRLSWDAVRRAVARRCDAAFARRLRWASWAQHGLFCPSVSRVLLSLAMGREWLWRRFFQVTR